MFGFESFLIPDYSIESEPEQCILSDPEYGYALADGQFLVTINEGLTYTATHREGRRITRYESMALDSQTVTLDFFGGSFPYGMGLDDSLAFPFLVQQHFPGYEVNNYSVPGCGTIQSLMQLEEKFANQEMPDILILCHANFHDERNDLSKSYQNKITYGLDHSEKLSEAYPQSGWAFPYGQLENGELVTKSKSIQDFSKVGFLREYSVLWNQFILLTQKAPSQEVTYAIIDEMKKLCESGDTRFIIASLTGEGPLKAHCEEVGIEFVNIEVPIHLEAYNLMPYDAHPSALAANEYAELIISYLETGR